jgi:uncharacterized protein YndB with AHSA1/START domain
MAAFSTETTIKAPVDDVWAALADIGNIYVWNPGVVQSHSTSETAEGMGATRYCDLGGSNFLDEEVVAWEPGEKLTMRIVGTNMPFETADIRFTLRPEGNKTVVTVSPEYTLKYGLVGRLMDRFYVRGTYEKGMGNLLHGLREYVESAQ